MEHNRTGMRSALAFNSYHYFVRFPALNELWKNDIILILSAIVKHIINYLIQSKNNLQSMIEFSINYF